MNKLTNNTKYFFALISMICLTQCNHINTFESQKNQDSVQTDNSGIRNRISEKIQNLDSISLPCSVSGNDTEEGIAILADELNYMKFDTVDQISQEYTYTFLKRVLHTNDASVVIIMRFFPEETISWLVKLDRNYKVKNFLEIAYENSEGSYSTQSKINTEMKITVITESDYEETDTRMYLLNENGDLK